MGDERQVRVALARWQVIAAATDERLGPSERGRWVAEIAGEVHRDADGRPMRVTARTVYRWLARWRADGFEGLKSRPRRDAGSHRVDAAVLELAAALRREAPARSAAHIAEVIARTQGVPVAARTLQRFFAAHGLERARLEGRHRAYGRFEAAGCGDLWIADAWDGPAVAELGGRHAQLFSVIDDHSRLVAHGAFYADVSERSFQHCLRTAIGRRGLPRRLYTDNGSAFSSGQLELICARLGIGLVHSRPYRPQGRGKKERFYRTVAEQFAVEIDAGEVTTLAELNRWWAAWVERCYHRRVHHTTGQTPLGRWMAGSGALRPAPEPAALADACRWSVQRTVSKTAGVSLAGNTYTVDPQLVGYRVELRYDPQDLTRIEVFCGGQPRGHATGEHIGTHTDPKLGDRQPDRPPPTGIAYLEAVAADHAALLRGELTYQPPPAHDSHNPTDDDDENDDDGDGGGSTAAPAGPTRPTSPTSQGATR